MVTCWPIMSQQGYIFDKLKKLFGWCCNLIAMNHGTPYVYIWCISLSYIVIIDKDVVTKYTIHCTKNTIHQVTTILATSKNVPFPGHNHLLTTDTDDASIAGAWAIIKVLGHQYRWLAGGYDLEIGHLVDSGFFAQCKYTWFLARLANIWCICKLGFSSDIFFWKAKFTISMDEIYFGRFYCMF